MTPYTQPGHSRLVPTSKGYFSGLEASKLRSEAMPVIGQVALLVGLFCVGKGRKKRCYGHPINAVSAEARAGARELRRWLKKRGNKRISGNEDVMCEVQLVSRVRKGKRVIGLVKKCYQHSETDDFVTED
jgi:hypothetical protein